MANFEADAVKMDQLRTWLRLNEGRRTLLRDLERWVAAGTQLHQAVGDTDKQAQIIQLRNEFTAQAKQILGIGD